MGQNVNNAKQYPNTRADQLANAFTVAPNVNAGKFAARPMAPARNA